MEAQTTSWLAVGWRPQDLSIACQKFPRETVPPRGQEIHPMDCTDMVIGMARDGRGFVADYYTRDRSTPRRDAFWVRGISSPIALVTVKGRESEGIPHTFFIGHEKRHKR